MSNSQGNLQEATLNTESCETILQVAQKLYHDELDRYKQIENKTAITLAFIGILIAHIISRFTTNKIGILINVKIESMLFCFDLLIIVGFISSIIYLLTSLTVSNFQQVKIDEIVNVQDAISDPAQVKIDIAATYQKIINHNMRLINNKAKKYVIGISLAKYSFILFSISFLIQEVIHYVTK